MAFEVFMFDSAATRVFPNSKLLPFRAVNKAKVYCSSLPFVFRVLLIVFLVHGYTDILRAQAPLASSSIDGIWRGSLQKDQKIELRIDKAATGGIKVILYSLNGDDAAVIARVATFQNPELDLVIDAVEATFTGRISADGTSIIGVWSQNHQSTPLTLIRGTEEGVPVASAIPSEQPAMAPDANLQFEVATIKLSIIGRPGKGFSLYKRRFRSFNTTAKNLIAFAYNIQPKQIEGGPGWTGIDKFDIDAESDGEGNPTESQWKEMLKKLLTQRFQLTFHSSETNLSAYVLTTAKAGPKLTNTIGKPDAPPMLYMERPGDFTVRNATLQDFCGTMGWGVLDRPVVDHTGLQGRWDFKLEWTPDDSQFVDFGMKLPSGDEPDAPPPLFAAIQEQLGLKFTVEKTAVKVIVIDRIQKPGEN